MKILIYDYETLTQRGEQSPISDTIIGPNGTRFTREMQHYCGKWVDVIEGLGFYEDSAGFHFYNWMIDDIRI